jgi:alginate O-acetyltransferase complex protein AlgI
VDWISEKYWDSCMAFSSLTFLFVFLPVFLMLYFVVPFGWWRNGVLLIFSVLFYSWAEPVFVFLLLAVSLLNWFFAWRMEADLSKGNARRAKWWSLIAVIGNLFVLLLLKYQGLMVESLRGVFGWMLPMPAKNFPLGLSFYIFSAISFIVDVYQREVRAPRNPLTVMLYISMFPKLLQGPIMRYETFAKDLWERKPVLEDFAWGARRFVLGLSKKVLIADLLAQATNKIFALPFTEIGVIVAWLGVIAYGLQIYFDFSGYTDMAIGLGRILGFHLPENFNYPYMSRSISEFWRRWHMTLTGWFRQYVFFPLEFARRRQKFFRQQINLMIVFLLTGIWHGASWNFLIWGGYFGLLLALESGRWGKMLKKFPKGLQHFYTIVLILIGWVLFRVEDISTWGAYFGALLGKNGMTASYTLRSLNVFWLLPVVLFAMFAAIPWAKRSLEKLQGYSWAVALENLMLLILFLLNLAFLLENGYQSFLYFQF